MTFNSKIKKNYILMTVFRIIYVASIATMLTALNGCDKQPAQTLLSTKNTLQQQALSYTENNLTPQPRGGKCEDSFDINAPLLNNSFGQDLLNTRNYPSIITQNNLADLTLNFTHARKNIKEKRGAPAVTAQAIIFTEGNRASSINRNSGCLYWSYTNSNKNADFRSSSIVYLKGETTASSLVFVGDQRGHVHAINAVTGKKVWSTFAGTSKRFHHITGGMQLYNNTLFVPVSSFEVMTASLYPDIPCCISHGLLTAIDTSDGKVKWRYHTTAEATQVILAGQRIGPNGASVWSSPAISNKHQAVYIGTGQNYTEPATRHSDAIISIDINSGKENWVFQATHNDTWNTDCQYDGEHCSEEVGGDFDFGASPILVNNESQLIVGDKAGSVYSLDAVTGAKNWQQQIGAGANLGGIHWGMAIDDQHVYAAVTDFSIDKINGHGKLVENAQPGIYALKMSDGSLVWSTHPSHQYFEETVPTLFSASLSVTNNVLFAASLNGEAKAFAVEDGQELWSYNTAIAKPDINNVFGTGGTIDSVGVVIAGDSLLINSGYNSFNLKNASRFQAGRGNSLFVFSVTANQQQKQ